MENLGFKKLNLDNWNNKDEILKYFMRSPSPDDVSHEITDTEWAEMIFEPTLDELVPIEIRRLFEVAQGVMCYGYFFYPLYTLGMEQLYRVIEAAVKIKSDQMGCPKLVRTFQKRIDYLIRCGCIIEIEKNHWHATRNLRNLSSHADDQTLILPFMAIKELHSAVAMIESIF